MLKRIIVVSMIALFAFSCSSKGDDPKTVADSFWKATKKGDSTEVKKYVTKSSLANIKDMKKADANDKGSFDLGKPAVDGETASIPTKITDQGMAMELKTILVKEDGVWKVDMNKTMMSMFGGAMEEMVKGLEGLGDKMGEAVGKGMEELGAAMEKSGRALEEKGKSLNAPIPEDVKAQAAAENKFKAGDVVTVEWHGRWWPATVIEVKPNSWKIHYDGYADSWDEWVGPERIKKK